MFAVVVLGVGRSGTSFLMQVLKNLGFPASENLIPAHAANKFGSHEDEYIFNIQRNLMNNLGFTPQLLAPEGWLNTAAARSAKDDISLYLSRVYEKNDCFAFKDTKSSTFLPLWTKIFNEKRIVPVYLLAVRRYSAIVESFVRNYGSTQDQVDAVWINRHLDALHHTGLDCHIVHYEDWFSDPESTLFSLRSYLESLGIPTADFDIRSIVDSGSNRALDEFEINNPIVKELEELLQDSRGGDFDKENMASLVKSCRRDMANFKIWSDIAHNSNLKNNNLSRRLAEVKKELSHFSDAKRELEILRDKIGVLENEVSVLGNNIEDFVELK